jgi:GxxExxY protein
MGFELEQTGIPLLRQMGIPIFYKVRRYRFDSAPTYFLPRPSSLKIKAVPALLPTHEAQLLAYLRKGVLPVGLLKNFSAQRASKTA